MATPQDGIVIPYPAPVTDGWLFVLVEIARVLTVLAGASCAARLIKVRKLPQHQYPPARRAGIQALMAFSFTLPFFAMISIVSHAAVGLASLIHPALLVCFWYTHRYLSKAESEQRVINAGGVLPTA